MSKKRLAYNDLPNLMNTRSNKELLFGHSLLHAWARDPSRTNWSKEAIIKEHERLVRIMRKRGIKHKTPLMFSAKWKKYY